MSSTYQSFNLKEQWTISEHDNGMLEILRDMSKSIARMQDLEVLDKQSNVILEIKEQLKVQGSHEIFENQKSNMLEDAPAIQIAFEDRRINAVEKIDPRDLVILN